jgi:hypothetical protein
MKRTHHLLLSICGLALWLLLNLVVVRQTVAQSTTGAPATDQLAVVGGRGAQMWDEQTPPQSISLPAGALLVVKGRSEDGAQMFVQTEGGEVGWVGAGGLLLVDSAKLPVITPRPAPGITQTVAAGAVLGESFASTQLTPTQPIVVLPTVTPSARSTKPEAALSAVVSLQGSRLNLRSGPDVAYPLVDKAEPGSQWLVIGRDPRGSWLQLQSPATGETAWAAAAYLQLDGAMTVLPVIANLPPPPAVPIARLLLPTPTPAPGSASVAVEPSAPVDGSVGKSGLSGLLAFQDRIGGMIYLYDLGSDQLRPLTSGIDPAISPDGRRVAFTRDGGGTGLYLINTDGSGEQRLYNDHPLLRSPSWSPDGRWIVFSRSDGYEDCRVVRGSVCLPDEVILESLPEGLQYDADIQKLVKDLPNQRAYHSVLARIAPDGSEYRDIPALNFASAPDWNAAGIVYHSDAGIQRTADLPDVQSVQVANDPLIGYFHDPDWQPGGGRIVFQRKQGSHWQIYAVNPDGSGLVALTRPVTALVDELPSNVSPAWSPDGQKIIYLSNRNSIESAGAWHFWVMNADGSDQRRLPIDVELDYTFSSEQMVSWAAGQ